ncbi:MAG: immunoglobulin domain-containing protein [Phycisphaerae bacterium]
MRSRNLCRFGVLLIAVAALASATSVTARAGDPPVITQHPASQTACEGANVVFTVVATGEDLSYQWRKDDEPLDGATSDMLLLETVTVSDSGDYDVVVTNPYGSVTSDAATLTVDTGPEIVEHPSTQTVCEGVNVTFTVVAAGMDLSYQWRKDGEPIDGATSDTLILDAVTVLDSGDYDVVVTNPCGAGVAISNAATLTVDTGPEIVEHPASQTVCAGVNVTLTVVAAGIDLSYQWRKDDVPIDGATSDTLILDAVTVLDSGDYDVVVTNPCGVGVATSNAATLIVDAGPEIIEHPMSQEVCEGASVTLSVTVSNPATTYEDAIGSTSSSGSGARMRGNYYRVNTDTTLTRIEQYLDISTPGMLLFFVYEADNLSGPYALIAEDAVPDSGSGMGYYSSNALAVPLQAGKYYIIGGAWPDAHTYYWNYSHPNATAFGISLNGFAYAYQDPLPDPPPTPSNSCAYKQRLTTSDLAMTYQWRKDDEDIPGAAGPHYMVHAMSPADVGDYEVVVTNDCGSVVSDTATLTLGLGVTIEQDPIAQGACVGSSITFTVVAQGPDLTYQWRKDGEDIADATGDAYTIEVVALEDAGNYYVVVSNPCATATSATATLTVADVGPTIIEQPANQAACDGDEVTLSVVAEGTGLEYQWRKNGANILGATDGAYTLSPADPNDSGDYDVVVTNPCGSVISGLALLVVDEALAIATQPVGELLCEGEGYTFTVVAAGTGLSYQWRKDGEDILDATSDSYSISPATIDDSGSYNVVVTNNCGSITSDPAPLTVVAGPVIEEQPADQWLKEGDPLTLSVQIDLASFPDDVDMVGVPAYSATGAKIRGNSYEVSQSTTLTCIEHYLDIATSGELTFFVYQADAEQGPYTLILEDVVPDSGTGLGFYASNPIEVTLEAGKYYIIGAAWPGSHTYYWGGSHPQPTAFGESVQGYATSYNPQLPYNPVPTSPNVYCQRLTTVQRVVSYQWRKDGSNIPDANSDTYSVAAVTPADVGEYDVVITNECGTVVSDPAHVALISLTPLESPQAPAAPQPRNPGP